MVSFTSTYPKSATRQNAPYSVIDKVRKSFHSGSSESGAVSRMPPSAADTLGDSLGSKLNSLTLEERSEGLHDLHGVADVEEENPAMLRAKVHELTRALENFTDLRIDEDTTAFEKAQQLDPEYVNRMKVVCLRSDKYQVRDAAARIIRFFSRKLQLFGLDKLCKEIQLPDLSVEEMHALQNGLIHLLPQRDRSGRVILILFGKLNPQYTTETVLRVLFYLSMVALQDEESQRRGFVLVYYGIGQKKVVRGRALEILKSWWATPMRIVAGHFCSENSAMHPAVKLMFYAMELSLLCRFRCHFGTNMECMYNLMTFGIPKEVLPITPDGTIELALQHEMLASLKRREEELEEEPTMIDEYDADDIDGEPKRRRRAILIPGPMDLVMGRGRHAKNAPGALRMRHLLEEHREQYDSASKYEKTVVAELVLKKMKESGCRFLKPAPEGWIECDDSVARGRLAHAFRNMRKGGTTTVASSNASIASNGSSSIGKKGEKRGLEF